MVKHWTETELTAKLKELTVIVDSKEKVNQHILSYFDSKKIPYKIRNLETGDYSMMIGDMTFEHDFFIERKANLTEICGNFTQNRDRFEREFLRAKANHAKPFLLIEDNTLDDVYLGDYRSQLSPKSLIASFLTWQVRFNTTIMFCNKKNSGRLIYGILYYAAREELLNGRI